MSKAQIIKIHPADNVAVAVDLLKADETITCDGNGITLVQDIPAGHKLALTNIPEGANVVKYGFPVGHAIMDIAVGAHVHAHNLKTNLCGTLEYLYEPQTVTLNIPNKGLTFNGYRRKNGEVGIRNELWIVPTVGCVNGIAESLANRMRSKVLATGMDGMEAFKHNYGCSQLGDDHENTRKILRDIVLHPNAGGVLVLALGCENNQMDAFRGFIGDYDTERVMFLEVQKVEDEIAEGLRLLEILCERASKDVREAVPLSELKVGLKCGASDGFSGITANPLVGSFSDFLVAQGGTTILTEVPEMFGAETLLMSRCINREVFNRTVHLINDFKDYFLKNDQPVYENPSPGNKAGGISTLEDKSLGCTQKGGTALVSDVLMYGDRVHTRGLNLLSAPGNDLVASTALGASGCQIVLFTTGRGTPFGSFVPTVKISSNSAIASAKPGWIDFNAGAILEGETMKQATARFIEFLIDVANGRKVNNEQKGYKEISIFKTGVTL
jgi:altronate hydrolase